MVISSFIGGLAGGASINIVIRGVDKFSAAFSKAGTGMQRLSRLAIGLGITLAATLAYSTKKAIDFEDAFAGVRKTVDLTEEEFAQLNQTFRDLSVEIPVTFEELSKIGEIAGQLGVTGVANLSKFTKVIADISATTNLSAEDAATNFARIANVMQEPLQNIDRMGSAVVDLGNNFATTESEILVFAQRISGSAKLAKLSTADIFGIATAFTSVGVQAESGGTAVQIVLQAMIKSIAQGGKKLEEFGKLTGQTGEEFARMFKGDASEAFEEFVKGLGREGDNAFQILANLGIENKRLTRGFLSLASAGDLITDSIATSNDAFKENNALTIEAEKRYETAASKVKELKNLLALTGAEIGDELLPAFKDMIESIKNNKDEIVEMGAAFGNLILDMIRFAGAVALFLKPAMDDMSIRQEAINRLMQDGIAITDDNIKIIEADIRARRDWEESEKKVAAGLQAEFEQEQLNIESTRKLTIKNKELANSFDEMANATNRARQAQEDFARVIGGRVYVGVGEVQAAYEARNIEMGYRTPKNIAKGGAVTVNIQNVNGMNPDNVASALQQKLNTEIS